MQKHHHWRKCFSSLTESERLKKENVGGIEINSRPDCKYNLSKKLPPMLQKHTNNDARIYGAYKALVLAKKMGFFRVEIRTDCKLLVDYWW